MSQREVVVLSAVRTAICVLAARAIPFRASSSAVIVSFFGRFQVLSRSHL
jgi:hypothetical protein